ncbi:MAG: polysaccharide biosynthesis/export family protein, partial [Balneolaceae bacterium]
MMKFVSAILLFSVVLLLSPHQSISQNVGGVSIGNIQNLQVDELTDDQILNFYRQMQAQGFTVQEMGNIARARGMPASEVSRLQSRLNQISSTSDRDSSDSMRSTSRSGEEASLLFEPFMQIEDELLISELRRLVEERNEEDLLKELDLIINEGFPVFGQNLFKGASRSFEPSFNIPTPIDYIFGADDEIRIDIWGAAEAEYNLIVTPDGNIRVPNLGPIRVAGLKFDEARDKIINNLKRIYSGINISNPEAANTYVDVSLGRVRSINVNMIGEIVQPGSY